MIFTKLLMIKFLLNYAYIIQIQFQKVLYQLNAKSIIASSSANFTKTKTTVSTIINNTIIIANFSAISNTNLTTMSSTKMNTKTILAAPNTMSMSTTSKGAASITCTRHSRSSDSRRGR